MTKTTIESIQAFATLDDAIDEAVRNNISAKITRAFKAFDKISGLQSMTVTRQFDYDNDGSTLDLTMALVLTPDYVRFNIANTSDGSLFVDEFDIFRTVSGVWMPISDRAKSHVDLDERRREAEVSEEILDLLDQNVEIDASRFPTPFYGIVDLTTRAAA